MCTVYVYSRVYNLVIPKTTTVPFDPNDVRSNPPPPPTAHSWQLFYPLTHGEGGGCKGVSGQELKKLEILIIFNNF